MLTITVCLFIGCLLLFFGYFFQQNNERQKKIFEDLAGQLKEFQKIPNLLVNPHGLKTIGEKNLEFLLTNVLPKDFVFFQYNLPGVGIVDTAIRVGDRILPID